MVGDDDVAARRCRRGSAPARAGSLGPFRRRACTLTVKARQIAPQRARRARDGPAEWLSIVTIDDAVRACDQRPKCAFASYRVSTVIGRDAALQREALGVAAGLAAHEERDLAEFASRPRRCQCGARGAITGCGARLGARLAGRCEGAAASLNSKSSRNMCSRCSSRPIISGWTQVSKITLAPSKPICGE